MDMFLEKRKYKIDGERSPITYYHPNGKPKYRLIHLIPLYELNSLHLLVGHADEQNDNMISFTSKVAMNKKSITLLVSDYQDAQVIIIIGKPSVQGQVEMEKQKDLTNVEFIDPSMYHFDRSLSFMVPTYRVLSKHEVTILLEKLHMKKSQFSHILRTDPIVRMYGYKPGQVLELINEQLWRLVI